MNFKIAFLILAFTAVIACRGPRGDQGTSGLNGQDGAVGAVGPQGETGLMGPAGADGTVISPVKFCSQSAAYPSTFPEYGFCINGQIYAVYNGGYNVLSLIPDGTYQSSAQGSACTFTVNGCKVSH